MSEGLDTNVKLTYREYCRISDDGKRHEIIDGAHYVNPAPETAHQAISGRMYVQLYAQIAEPELGQVYYAPTDLQLSDHDIVQPDLIVILNERQGIITQKKIDGVPDMVVEILSPSTRQLDLGPKLRLYRRAGVPEYWIVDPDARIVEQHLLRDGEFTVFRHSERVVFQGLPDVAVNVLELW